MQQVYTITGQTLSQLSLDSRKSYSGGHLPFMLLRSTFLDEHVAIEISRSYLNIALL